MTKGKRGQYFAVDSAEGAPDLADVVSALRALFEEPRLRHVPADHTAVLEEGDGADLVIRHPSVPGLSLVIDVGTGRAELFWAQVTTLEWKDDIDAARGIGQSTVRLDDGGAQALAAAVRHQLEVPLRIVETSQFGKRLATEIRAPDPGKGGEEYAFWARRTWRVPLPFAPRQRQSRQESFLSLIPYGDLVMDLPLIFVEGHDVGLFASAEAMTRKLEPPDVRDDAYAVFDSAGRRVELAVEPGIPEQTVISSIESEPTHEVDLRTKLISGLGAAFGDDPIELDRMATEKLVELAIERYGYER